MTWQWRLERDDDLAHYDLYEEDYQDLVGDAIDIDGMKIRFRRKPVTLLSRGRDTSMALSEVRTVLGRATTALEYLHAIGALYERDPDHDSICKALEEVIDLLEPWRRTGRRKGDL